MKNKYNFLPFRFQRKSQNTLLTNEVGDFAILSNKTFEEFIQKKLNKNQDEFLNLKSKNFLYDQNLSNIIEVLSTKYRTKNKFLYDSVSLHMFVVTLRCNQKCSYCHVSSQNEKAGNIYNMDKKTARKCVEFAFNTPSHSIKIEFQGGEPLLNFDVVKAIVEYSETLNESYQKHLEFVICTNLVNLRQEHLDYFKEKKIVISTSLDGPREIHNKFRKLRNGSGSYDQVIHNIEWAKNELEEGSVSALMTVTSHNVNRLKDVVDEYIKQRLEYIFIRKLNPFGYAYKNEFINYNLEDFIKGYKEVLEYIIQINLQGKSFPEIFATILLSRILTPFSTGFVDLQSPAGAGISCLLYDVNGDIFVSDEGRMLYRTTNDKKFCIGNAHYNLWQEVLCNPELIEIAFNSCIDAIPGCSWCVYKPYCGSDPIRNYITQGDMVGPRPTNDFCKEHFSIFKILFDYLELENDDIEDVFWSWITNRNFDQVRNYSSSQLFAEKL